MSNETILEGLRALREKATKKNRLIFDECTPTRNRRPTTVYDIDEDIHVMDFESANELFNFLLDYCDIMEEELESDTLFDKVNELLSWYTDPGDGSPNFLYCILDDKICPKAMPYDCLDKLDLSNCSEKDVKEVIKTDCDYIDEDDYMNEEVDISGEQESDIVIPGEYSKFYELADEDYIPEEEEYHEGDEIRHYPGTHFLSCLFPKPEIADEYNLPGIGVILTDNKDYPVCELVGGRLYPIDLEFYQK